MALRDRLEIYIPAEADVRSIALCSLPNSVQRRMGLPRFDSDGSKKLANSPKGTWICPAVIRRKGQQVASDTGNDVKKEFLSLMGRESQTRSDPQRLSFVSSNRTAYKVLKDTKQGSSVSADTSHTSLQFQDLSPPTTQDAVVVYNGQIYLSLRNPNRNQSKRKTSNPQMVSQPFAPSTSDLSSESQRKVLPDNQAPKKQITCKVTHNENTKCVAQKESDVSSSMNAHSVPESTDSGHRADSQQNLEPDWFKPQEEKVADNVSGESEMQDLGSEEAESRDHTSDMDFFNSPGEDDQGSAHIWTRSEGAATSLQKEFEYTELKQDEEIARMKAKLKERKDALNSLTS